MRVPIAPLRADVSEDAFKDTLIDTAIRYGWTVAHFRPARTERGWRTPMQGHKGFPDLVLARAGRVIFAELKSATGRPTKEQRAWLAAVGVHGRLWRPADWPTIVAELRPQAA